MLYNADGKKMEYYNPLKALNIACEALIWTREFSVQMSVYQEESGIVCVFFFLNSSRGSDGAWA